MERQDHRHRTHQMRARTQQPFALVQRLADEGEMTVLQVAEAAVHEPRAARAGAGGDVAPVAEHDRQAANRRFARDRRALDAGPDDEEVTCRSFEFSWVGSQH